ncbi:MAG: hypothetical protein NVS3B7_05650 [Candidatus Elarobacter sp.]
MSWRVVVTVVALAVLAWGGFEIARAGGDIPVQKSQGNSTLLNGTVSGKRIDGRAWSLDYDTVSMSPDGTLATIAHVKDGRIHRVGKPDVLMKAAGVTVNTITNDLNVTGVVAFSDDLGHGRVRTFETTGARYAGATRTLTLEHPATITDSGATIHVASMTIDFRTGDAKIGRIEASRPGSAP